jgi:hypothetical protein
MVDQALLNYIWGYLQQGYDSDSIRSSLLGQGYKEKDVDEAFSVVYSSKYHNNVQSPDNSTQPFHLHINKTEAIAGVFLVVGIIIIGMLLYSYVFSTSGDEVILPTGNDGTGDDTGFVPYYDSDDDDVGNDEDVFSDEDLTPPNDDIIAVNNGNDELIGAPEDNVVVPPLVEPQNQKQLSRLQIDQKVEEVAATDPLTAATYCPQIITKNGENSCYAKVAIISGQEKFCQYVSTEKQQDFCYMQFAIEGKGSQAICAYIKDSYRRDSCLQLLALHVELEAVELQRDSVETVEYTDEQIQEAYTDSRFVGADGEELSPGDDEVTPEV